MVLRARVVGLESKNKILKSRLAKVGICSSVTESYVFRYRFVDHHNDRMIHVAWLAQFVSQADDCRAEFPGKFTRKFPRQGFFESTLSASGRASAAASSGF